MLILKTFHIALAMAALGASISYRFLQARGESEPEHLVFMLRSIRQLDRSFTNPCYIGVLITGIWMVIQAGYSFAWLWIWYSLSVFGTIALLGIFAFKPVISGMIRHAQPGSLKDEYLGYRRKAAFLGNVVLVLVLSVLCMMVWKPI